MAGKKARRGAGDASTPYRTISVTTSVPPVLVGTPSLAESAASLTIAVPVPAGTTAGEVLLCLVSGSRVTSGDILTTPAGWTLAQLVVDPSANGIVAGLYWRVATGTETSTYTWTCTAATAGRISGSMQRFAGVDTTTPMDVAADSTAVDAVSGLTVASPSVTTVTTQGLLVGAGIVNAASSSVMTPPLSMTLINTTTGVGRRQTWATEVFPPVGATGARTWTASFDALQRIAIIAVLRSGTGGVIIPPGGGTSPILNHRVVGPTGIVAVQTTAVSARLKIGTDPGVTTGVTYTSSLTPDSQGNTHHATALPAGSTRYYRVMMTNAVGGEFADTAAVGKILTAPTWQTSFSFCFSGDHHLAGDSPAMAAVAGRGDSLFLFMGDLFNPDNSDRSIGAYRTQMASRVEYPNYQSVLSTTPSVYTGGDHDYGMENDSTGTTVPTAIAPHNQVYREFWPINLVQPVTGEYFTFAWGRVRFIILDAHTWKSAYTATDNASKTMLGVAQKQWFKDTITASNEEVIFFAQHYAFSSSPVTNDGSWSGYTTERTELVNFMNASGNHFVAMHGDMHAAAWCDGTAYAGGILDIDGSPVWGSASQKGSPWNQIYPSSGTASTSSYGRVVVTDTGSQIAVAFTGYSSDNTARVSHTSTFTVGTSTGPVPLGPSGAWALTFQDEFAGSSVDTSKWTVMEGRVINNVTCTASNVRVANGECILTLASSSSGAEICTHPDPPYTGGQYLLPTGSFTEARIYFPGSGATIYNWPAWWASGGGSAWPAWGENDIAESLGTMTVNYHSPSGSHNQGTVPGTWSNAFHTYGLHRKATSCDVYYDGVLVKTYGTDDNGGGQSLIINIGDGNTRVTGAGSEIRVDYVRAWAPA